MDWRRRSSVLRGVGLACITTGLVALSVILPVRFWDASNDDLDRISGWADVLAYSMGALGVALTVIERMRRANRVSRQALDDVADRLTHQVLQQESLQRARLLGTGQTATAVANLYYHQAEGPQRRPGGAAVDGGTLETIGRYYTERTRQRLVILGDPGSGKSVLALELLIQLLDRRCGVADPRYRALLPVPVRFSLPAWNTDRPLRTWLAGEVATRFGVSGAMAQVMVDSHRILPVLDGLDEMDPPAAPPERAIAAVAQLNNYLHGRTGAPVVVTCRSDDYRRLRETAGIVIRPATEITIQPLTPDQIRDYLDTEYDCSIDRERRQQWEPVLHRLGDSGDRRPATALGTPWRLTLAVAYHRDGGDLGPLLPTTDELAVAGGSGGDPYLRRVSGLLLAAFIPARARMHDPDRYPVEEITGWCRTAAEHLGGRVDIVLHEWWSVAGADRVRRWHVAAATGLTLLLGLSAGITAFRQVGDVGGEPTGLSRDVSAHVQPDTPLGLVNLAWLAIVLLMCPGLAMWRAASARIAPARTNPQQLRTARGRRQLARSLTAGLAIGAVAGSAIGVAYVLSDRLTIGLAVGLRLGIGYGLAAGLVYGLAYGLRPIGEVSTDPRDPLRNDLAVWLAIGGTAGLGYGVAFGPAAMPADGLAFGLAAGLAFGFAGHAWLRYTVAMVIMANRRRLPLRFGRFLHWACQAGILRAAGHTYQFRHVELRDWLRDELGHPAGTVVGGVRPTHDSLVVP